MNGFVGSLPFVFVHALLMLSGIAINGGWTPLEPTDPTFVILATVASVEATLSHIVRADPAEQDGSGRGSTRGSGSAGQPPGGARNHATHQHHSGDAAHLNIELEAEPELDELEHDIAPEQGLDSLDARR